MIRIFLLILLFSISGKTSFSQEWKLEWANSFGGSSDDYGFAIDIDKDGNTYVAGGFQGTVDFDPGSGTNFRSSSGSYDIFCVKFNRNGKLIWAKSFGNNGYEQVNDLKLDNNANIYLCGRFSGTVDFNPGTGVNNLSGAGQNDGFVVKLDSSGNFKWCKNVIRGSGNDFPERISVTNNGYLYTLGGFNSSSADTDPGSGSSIVSSNGARDIFLIKLDTSGNHVWTRQFGGSRDDYSAAMMSDDSANTYAAIRFGGTVDFDPSTGVKNLIATGSATDMAIVKLDPNGNLIWVRQVKGNNNWHNWAWEMHVDREQNTYYTGKFESTVDWDPGAPAANLTATGSDFDLFVLKLNKNGNFAWVKKIDASTGSFGLKVSTDKNLNVLVAGYIEGTTDLDPGPNIIKHVASDWDCALIRLDSTGNYLGHALIVGSQNIEVADFVLENEKSIILTGKYYSTADFDPSSSTFNLSSNGRRDIFVNKIEPFVPELDLGPDTTLCLGDSIKLSTGLNDLDHLWSDNSTDTILWVKNSGKYFVEVYYYNDTLRDTIDVKFDLGNHTPHLGRDTSVCFGDSVLLDTKYPGLKHYWSHGDTTAQVIVPVGGPYIVFVTNALGCTRTDTIEINSHALVVVDLGKDTAICDGNILVLDAGSGHKNYKWSTTENSQSIQIDTSGEYSVVVTSNDGCIGLDTIKIDIAPTPSDIDLGKDTAFCEGTNYKLETFKPTYSHLWNNGKTTPTIFVNTTGIHWVEVTNSYGCSYKDSIELSFLAAPKFSLGFNREICEGDSVLFQSKLSTADYKHFWNTGDTLNTVWGKLQGQYILSIKNKIGCESKDTVELKVNPKPKLNLGPNRNACLGSKITLRTGLKGVNYSYNWNTGQTEDSIVVTNPGLYFVEVFDQNNCFATDSIRVVFNPKPTVYVGPDTAFCNLKSYQINAEGDSIITYQWNTGENTKYIIAQNSGKYFVKVYNKYNCDNADTININENDPPIILLDNDTFLHCDRGYLKIEASSNAKNYLWNTGEITKEITVFDTGWYYVESSIPFCTTKDSIYVDEFCPRPYEYPEFYIPNSFTPHNNDGLNQEFKPVINGPVTNYNLQVYNRWGEKLFDSKNPQEGWNGTANGVNCQQDVYMYILTYKYTNGIDDYLSGTITLFR